MDVRTAVKDYADSSFGPAYAPATVELGLKRRVVLEGLRQGLGCGWVLHAVSSGEWFRGNGTRLLYLLHYHSTMHTHTMKHAIMNTFSIL